MNQYAFLACITPRTILIQRARAGTPAPAAAATATAVATIRRAAGMRLANNGPTYESISRRSPVHPAWPSLAHVPVCCSDTWVRRRIE